MLIDLSIKNIAVIDKLNLSFHKGMSVLTGETGAGKSIIIDSINLILGARTNKGLIRYGEEKASVQAVFEDCNGIYPLLEEYGIDTDEEQLIISRQITSQGKNICRINGTIVPLAALKEIADGLINIHGQHDNQALLTPSKHILFLDAYAECKCELDGYRAYYDETVKLDRKIEELKVDEQEKARRIDLLEYQIEEISKAKLSPGEDRDLLDQLKVIENAEKISANLEEAYENAYGGAQAQSAYDAISIAVSALGKVTEYDPRLGELYDSLSSAMYTIEDVSHEIKDHADSVEFDEAVLNDIEERLDLISKLKRKYGSTIEEILSYKQKAEEELEEIRLSDERIEELSAELEKNRMLMKEAAAVLSEKRHKAAQRLEQLIEQSLHELNMERAQFKVAVAEKDFSPNGADEAEFMFSANAGEPLKPLVNIASGGELSRVMLAMKSVLAESDGVQTLIFDEIDTGVSGSAAQKIAKKLKETSKTKQVICITHLPQLTSAADNHYLIEKHTEGDRTFTVVRELTDDERVNELARMIDGANSSETARLHARELLEKRGDSD